MMPRIDGFAVLKYISEHRPELLPNVIVVTAYGPNVIEKVTPSVVRIVEKPFDLTSPRPPRALTTSRTRHAA
jgi:CheY-like chemotaxis protein